MKDPSFNGQEKLMEVCEVCGAFLIIGDAQIRVDDHLQGKQHKGYAQIKATVEEMKVRCVSSKKEGTEGRGCWFVIFWGITPDIFFSEPTMVEKIQI